ncbi:hypothetical protein [Oceanobacillus chungangensis]|uniref:Uncharacterized protein n=1 Tax=Oceanobacillus chungangensis TaxID=1229152 RepID=A0A3D8PU03_9BACI|nr:hypothetical protein [Oceanobacillus chungangensis]RDW18781.1 hypothetical protein CWR45_09305 [Oceanobacillus chungangensis]
MLKVKCLQELNGYESGVVIYKDGIGFVTNWSGINGLPRQFITRIFGFDEILEFSRVNEAPKEIMEIALELAEQDQKKNGIDEKPRIDEIFESEDCCIFTFEEWN